MKSSCIKSIRMPVELLDKLKFEADDLGISLNNYILSILKNRSSSSHNTNTSLVIAISKWIRENFTKNDFPPDITLKVFLYIKNNEDFFSTYKTIIEEGIESKISLHRQIGMLVKEVLNAKVIGRSIPLDPKINLIKTYSILAPGVKKEQ